MDLRIDRRSAIVVAISIGALFAISALWPLLLLVVGALIVAAGLAPLVGWLVQRSVSRPFAVLSVFIALTAVTVGLLAIMIPAVVDAATEFSDDAPQAARDIEDIANKFGFDSLNLEQRARAINWGELAAGSLSYDSPVIVGLLAALTVLVVAGYLLIEAPRLAEITYQFVPRGREAEFTEVLTQLTSVVGGYVRGQLITSGAITLFTFLVLLFAGTPNPLAIALVAGVADVVPLIGAFIAVGVAVAATLAVSTDHALVVLIVLVIYQQFEDRILVPRIYARTLGLSPLVVLLAVLAGAQLLGIVGVLLALPTVAAGRVLMEYSVRIGHGPRVTALPDTAPERETAMESDHGIGKCETGHPGSFGFPSRPESRYEFCSECGTRMLWACSNCGHSLPEDPTELAEARYCRNCGHEYFTAAEDEPSDSAATVAP